jgi:peptide/nickel transport system permease protein
MGLLLTTTFISWLVGNAIGLIAGFRKEKTYSKILEGIAIVLYPIPYYIFALIMIILFAYVFPIFPLATSVRGVGLSWQHIQSIVWNSLLPACSMIVLGLGWWVISMKTLVTNVSEEEYVHFARLKGLPEHKIMTGYVLPNATLPQITMLALQIGRVFGGALVTEILFSYPGIGMLIYSGIVQNDYNLIMGGISITIVAVALATLFVDLIYPFLDPRVRYT